MKKNYLKIFMLLGLLVIILLMGALLSGCRRALDITRAEAREIVTDFIEKLNNDEFRAAYRMVSRQRGIPAEERITIQSLEEMINEVVVAVGDYQDHEITYVRSRSRYFEITVTAEHGRGSVIYTIRVDLSGDVIYIAVG